MSYLNFLLLFLGIPLILLGILHYRDVRQGIKIPPALRSWPPLFVIAALVVVALIYTTPWDNYLVATRVWWYDPELVLGIILGWVPLEEYIFFVVQTVLTSSWLLFLAKRVSITFAALSISPAQSSSTGQKVRWTSVGLISVLWAGSIAILVSGWRPGTYLALELGWALIPILLQVGFGGDILWRYRKLLFWTIAPATLYLSGADALAISSGTWTIDPAQSTGLGIGLLPLEEILFFLLTNTLVAFGSVLVLAKESQERAPKALLHFLQTVTRQSRSASVAR
jgi:lycopene beta-cyclase